MNTGPKKTTFSRDELSELRLRVQREIDARSLTKSGAAKEVGIGGSTFTEFLSGKYQGDNNAVASKLMDWLTTLEDRDQVNEMIAPSPDFQATRTAEEFHASLLFAQPTPPAARYRRRAANREQPAAALSAPGVTGARNVLIPRESAGGESRSRSRRTRT